MVEDGKFIAEATLDQVCTMPTYCGRGESFSEGLWGEMITNGRIRLLLLRLKSLAETEF